MKRRYLGNGGLRLLIAVGLFAAVIFTGAAGPLPIEGERAEAAKKKPGKKAKKKRPKPCRSTKGRVLRSSGYKGSCRAPKTNPAAPLPSVTVSERGRFPNLIVDDAGTAHIVWTEEGGEGPDRLRYCRIKRAAQACDNPVETSDLAPAQPSSPGNTPDLSDDAAGPRVAAIGNDLALMTFRFPYMMPKPIGPPSAYSTYLWVSDDGGQSVTGPGLVGDLEPNGGIVVFGPPDARRIGVIANRTGMTLFQALSPGTYTNSRAELALGGDRAYDGSLAEVDGLPMAAYGDLSNRTYIRKWSGAGSPHDPTAWSENVVEGTAPRLAAGPAGTFLVTRPELLGPLQVRRLNGLEPGPAVTVAQRGTSHRDIYADPGGRVRLAWAGVEGGVAGLLERSSRDGTSFGPVRMLARSEDQISHVDLGAAADGGGFAAYVTGGNSQAYGQVKVAPFGRQEATGVPGLGGLPGSGASPDTTVSCQEIAYGVVQMLSPEGCLLSASGRPGTKVSEGTIKLNGLEIVPDAGARILLGTNQKTIDSVGRVTVQLPAPGGPIVLFRGEIHLRLGSAADRVRLASFDVSKFPVKVKGFPVKGEVDIVLRDKSVEIPIALTLPKAFGGLTGQATLKASNAGGLELSSMRFRVGNLVLGPVALRNLAVDWASGGNWSGGAEVSVAGAAIGAQIEFAGGAFKRGYVSVSPVPFPGVPLFTNVFLNGVSGELWIDPFAIEAGATFGAQPIAPPDTYVFGVNSKLKVSTRPVFAIDARGSGRLAGFPMAEAHFHGDAAGLFAMKASARIEVEDVVGAGVEMDGFVDAGKGQFGARAKFDGCLGSPPLGVCSGFEGVMSSKGLAGCAGGFIGVGYRWGGSVKLLGPPSCDTGDYRAPTPLSGGGDQPDFSLPGGLPSATVRLTGTGQAPEVVLIDPAGQQVAPTPVGAEGAAGAKVTHAVAGNETYVGIRNPAAGGWKVERTGGGQIESLELARGLAAPQVKGKVRRLSKKRGSRRQVLTYTATSRPGLSVSFFEQVGQGARLIGTTTKRKGRIKFGSGDGPAGRRAVYALVEQDGLPRLRRVIARYKAPGPIRPSRVRGLRLKRSSKAVVATWRKSAGAANYLVRVTVSDGRTLQSMPVRPRLRIGNLRKSDRVKVKVRGRSPLGRLGPGATKRSR